MHPTADRHRFTHRSSLRSFGFGCSPLGRIRRWSVLFALIGLASPLAILRADWVTLRNGDVLRGVDLERDGESFRFTREDGVRISIPAGDLFFHERGPARDLVEFEGRTVTLREKIESLQAARRAELLRQVRDVESWARGEAALARKAEPATKADAGTRSTPAKAGAAEIPGAAKIQSAARDPKLDSSGGAPRAPQAGVVRIPDEEAPSQKDPTPVAKAGEPRTELSLRVEPAREELRAKLEELEEPDARAALDRFLALSEPEQANVLRQTLEESGEKAARYLAARELARYPGEASLRALAARALADSYRSVRDRSLRSLHVLDPEHGQFVDLLAAGLSSVRPEVRERAANAIAVLPHRRAVGPLLESAYLAWVGFGRGYFMQVTQRAYVADYELVSGGTGFAIIEVADPVVRTLSTGVALDVDVRRVEAWGLLRALRRASGQDFGGDLKAWRAWWNENREP